MSVVVGFLSVAFYIWGIPDELNRLGSRQLLFFILIIYMYKNSSNSNRMENVINRKHSLRLKMITYKRKTLYLVHIFMYLLGILIRSKYHYNKGNRFILYKPHGHQNNNKMRSSKLKLKLRQM